MARCDPSGSESEDDEDRSSEEEESEESNGKGQQRQGISEYEKQRLSRIAENKARMEALGLSKLASSLIGSPQDSDKRKGKRKVVEDDDEDYRPNDGDGADDDDADDDDGFGDDVEVLGNKSSSSDKRKMKKNKSSKPRKKASVQKLLSSSDYVADDDDKELLRAIALSLQHSTEVSGSTLIERKGNARIQEDTGRGKRRKSQLTSRVQMTEDEVILHFFQFDEAGKGSINMRDLRRVAIAHDFTWTDEELADMIYCFDSDGDEKLSLEDFRKIVSRCNMIQASADS